MAPETEADPDLQGIRVLYFDENHINRSVAELFLQEYGANVKTVPTAALLADAVTRYRFDVLVVDGRSAAQDEEGYTLALRDPIFRELPTIAVGETAEAAEPGRTDSVLPAPLDPQELVREIRRLHGADPAVLALRRAASGPARPNILAVDDSSANLSFICACLEDEYRVSAAESGEAALAAAKSGTVPDLVLLDVTMPGIDGYETCRRLKQDPRTRSIPVIFLTSLSSEEDEERGLALGAVDYIRKPFSVPILKARVRSQLELVRHREYLEMLVERRTRELRETQHEVVLRLAMAAEYRDNDTGSHIKRLGYYAMTIAEGMGFSRKDADLMYYASPMHDIGKLGIPDHILLKPGKLTEEEWEIMKTHTTIGARLLEGHPSQLLCTASSIALTHHEKWDGSGYPAGLAGEAIPIEGRIVSICDVFDALISERPYKPRWSYEEALDEINRLSGRQFDPAAVRAFNDAFPELVSIREQRED